MSKEYIEPSTSRLLLESTLHFHHYNEPQSNSANSTLLNPSCNEQILLLQLPRQTSQTSQPQRF
eukprot:gene7401-9761_t